MYLYQWINHQKARFYTITINKNEKNVIINHSWGSLVSKRRQKKEIVVSSKEEASKIIADMMKRRQYRGYELISA